MRNTTGSKNPNWRGGIRKSRGDGYILEYCPNHPFASNGAVLQHRLVYERHNKITLMPYTIIHHKNGVSNDNRIENLEATTRQKHSWHHFQTTLKGKQYRSPKLGKVINCFVCSKNFYVPRYAMNVRKFCSRKCFGKSETGKNHWTNN